MSMRTNLPNHTPNTPSNRTGNRIPRGGLPVNTLPTANPTTTTPPPMTWSAPRQNHIHHTSVLATRRVEDRNPQTTTRHSGLLATQRALFEPLFLQKYQQPLVVPHPCPLTLSPGV